jgi:uncharacterized protein YceK
MKRALLVLMMAVLLTGCKTTVTEDVDNACYQNAFNQFVVVEERRSADCGTLSIMYDKDTKVMYYMWDGNSYTGGFTPIYNADGSVKVYDD